MVLPLALQMPKFMSKVSVAGFFIPVPAALQGFLQRPVCEMRLCSARWEMTWNTSGSRAMVFVIV